MIAAFHVWEFWAIAGVSLACWRIDVWAHPFAACRRCKGTGWNPGSRSSANGVCKHGARRVRLFAKKAAARHRERLK